MKSSSIGKAFGRVNLLGEHLDYNGGCVLPLQINKSVTIKLEHKSDIEGILIKSRDYKEEISITNYSKKLNNWADFIIGSCDYFKRFYKTDISNISVNIESNLPIGIGLSSSAATCVSMIRALSSLFEINLDQSTMVKIAHCIENDFVGVGGGVMDQFVSVYGATDKALFLNTKNNDYKLIPLFDDYNFQIIDSGIKRILSDSAFNDRKNMCNQSAEKMGLEYLCDRDMIDEKDKDLLSNSEFKVSRHVIEENIRSKKGSEALLNNDPKLFGELMTQSHHSLANDYVVSCPELDQLVELCNEYGAMGAKLTGAGFGGAIVTLIKNDLVEGLKEYIFKNYSNAKFI